MVKRLLLLSTSTVHGSGFLEYAEEELRDCLGEIGSVLFVPFARPSGRSHDEYTRVVRDALGPMGYDVTGIHEASDPRTAVREAEAIYIGGGNTFVLLAGLYTAGVVDEIRERVADGVPYLGASAGSNVAGMSICTTNDMPIMYPPSFRALELVPFNINPHYVDPDPSSTHMGETRETRIREFHVFNEQPVLGLREGAILRVEGSSAMLRGRSNGRLFLAGQEPREIDLGEKLEALLPERPTSLA